MAVLLILVGALAGFVNTLAGAGSLLSLRALMFAGLSPTLANATNRIPVLVQSATATLLLRKALGGFSRRDLAFAAIPPALGAATGALAASAVPDRIMTPILLVVLLGTAALGLRDVPPRPSDAPPSLERPPVMVWLFVSGMYGGFLQAGVGLMLLRTLLHVAHLDIARANALKALIVAVFSTVAATVFIARGQVLWGPASWLAIGALLGAAIGSRVVLGSSRVLKILVVVVDAVACVALAWREASSIWPD